MLKSEVPSLLMSQLAEVVGVTEKEEVLSTAEAGVAAARPRAEATAV
jgi:hypothetical protein